MQTMKYCSLFFVYLICGSDLFWEADVNLRSNLELEKQYLMLND